MDYVHHCVFCGWSRPGASPTILSPVCERCGCALRSSSVADFEATPIEDHDAEATHFAPGLVRFAALGMATLLVLAAVIAGWREGGFWIAVVGLGLAGLASLSLPYPTRR